MRSAKQFTLCDLWTRRYLRDSCTGFAVGCTRSPHHLPVSRSASPDLFRRFYETFIGGCRRPLLLAQYLTESPRRKDPIASWVCLLSGFDSLSRHLVNLVTPHSRAPTNPFWWWCGRSQGKFNNAGKLLLIFKPLDQHCSFLLSRS